MEIYYSSHACATLFCVLTIFNGNWVNAKECESGVCCTNYYRENEQCKECPLGTYGVNCVWTCPENFYGLFCELRCKCSVSQYCNLSFGCISNYGLSTEDRIVGTTIAAFNSANTKAISKWKIIVIALLALTVIGVSGAVIYKLRLKIRRCHWSFHQTTENYNKTRHSQENMVELHLKGASNSFHKNPLLHRSEHFNCKEINNTSSRKIPNNIDSHLGEEEDIHEIYSLKQVLACDELSTLKDTGIKIDANIYENAHFHKEDN